MNARESIVMWEPDCAASRRIALPALAQDSYVIGVSGALTGPAAGTTRRPVEALRIYFDKLNAAGGINGKQVKLIILDDGAEPSKAAANAKRLLTQDNVQLMILSSFSSTFAPVSPKPSAPTCRCCSWARSARRKCRRRPIRCSSAPPPSRQTYDSRAALDFVKEQRQGTGEDRLCRDGGAAVARRDRICRRHSKTLGMTPVAKENIPPPTPDYTPFATKLKEADAELDVLLGAVGDADADASRRCAGSAGRANIIAWAHLEAEAELRA